MYDKVLKVLKGLLIVAGVFLAIVIVLLIIGSFKPQSGDKTGASSTEESKEVADPALDPDVDYSTLYGEQKAYADTISSMRNRVGDENLPFETVSYMFELAKNGKTPPLYACWDGKVVCARFSSSAGNWVQIEHTDETTGKVYTATYMHLTEYYVAEGDTVSKGDCIGIVGKTGCSQGEHLHFQINRGAYNSTTLDNIINPRFFIGDALGPEKEDEHSYLIMY